MKVRVLVPIELYEPDYQTPIWDAEYPAGSCEPRVTIVEAGEYSLVEIDNPTQPNSGMWLVIDNTVKGAGRPHWEGLVQEGKLQLL